MGKRHQEDMLKQMAEMFGPAPSEPVPPEELRAGAKQLYESYSSYVEVGFTEDQSFQLLLMILQSSAISNLPS